MPRTRRIWPRYIAPPEPMPVLPCPHCGVETYRHWIMRHVYCERCEWMSTQDARIYASCSRKLLDQKRKRGHIQFALIHETVRLNRCDVDTINAVNLTNKRGWGYWLLNAA